MDPNTRALFRILNNSTNPFRSIPIQPTECPDKAFEPYYSDDDVTFLDLQPFVDSPTTSNDELGTLAGKYWCCC